MKTIEFDYVDKEQTNTIIRAARANGMDAMMLPVHVVGGLPTEILSIEGEEIPLHTVLTIGWESLDVDPVTTKHEAGESKSIVQALDKIHQALTRL